MLGDARRLDVAATRALGLGLGERHGGGEHGVGEHALLLVRAAVAGEEGVFAGFVHVVEFDGGGELAETELGLALVGAGVVRGGKGVALDALKGRFAGGAGFGDVLLGDVLGEELVDGGRVRVEGHLESGGEGG